MSISHPQISIIIPVLNENEILGENVRKIKQNLSNSLIVEIILCDGGSDELPNGAYMEGCKLIKTDARNRAVQMNSGAKIARSEVLYFLHADSIPPKNFDKEILEKLEDKRTFSGCFQMRFDAKNMLLSFYSFFTRFNQTIFHGGDASLFVRKEVFKKIEGYNEKCLLMEDYDLLRRLKKKGGFVVIPSKVITSARKYLLNGVLRLQWIYLIIHLKYSLGFNQKSLVKYYKKKVA